MNLKDIPFRKCKFEDIKEGDIYLMAEFVDRCVGFPDVEPTVITGIYHDSKKPGDETFSYKRPKEDAESELIRKEQLVRRMKGVILKSTPKGVELLVSERFLKELKQL